MYSIYECKNLEYTKYKNKKCILEKKLSAITKQLKETNDKMFIYISIILLINLYIFNSI